MHFYHLDVVQSNGDMSKAKSDSVLPVQLDTDNPKAHQGNASGTRRSRGLTVVIVFAALACSTFLWSGGGYLLKSLHSDRHSIGIELESFYHSVETHDSLCAGGVSHSGYIGLIGDTEGRAKKAFYWYASWYCLWTDVS